MEIIIIMPVFNDWESANILLEKIQEQNINHNISILIVNDCSNKPINIKKCKYPVNIISLNRNMGHQRSIAVGLCYCNEHFKNMDAIIIMDSDGEDAPEYIPKMVNSIEDNNCIYFAKRVKRSEGYVFRLFYKIYKLVFYILIGRQINFGNYSILPSKYLNKIVNIPEIWNHYSSAILKSHLEYNTINTIRGKRYFGKSKMNLSSLIIHGFSSLSVYSELILTRLTIFSSSIILVNFLLIIIILYLKLIAGITSPGWATSAILNLIIISIVLFVFSFLIGLVILNQRNLGVLNNSSTIYKNFIETTDKQEVI
jgi:hypothetical protein